MNKAFTRSTIAAAGIGLVAVAIPVAAAGPASAVPEREIDRKGSCSMGKATYDFDVEKERNGNFDVDFELDGKAGQEWKIKMKHGKAVYYSAVRTTDREGEVDLDRDRKNTKGKDTFRVKATNLGTNEVCKATITFAK